MQNPVARSHSDSLYTFPTFNLGFNGFSNGGFKGLSGFKNPLATPYAQDLAKVYLKFTASGACKYLATPNMQATIRGFYGK